MHPYITSCRLFNSDTLFVHLWNTSILSYFIKLQPSRCHPYSQINKCLGPFKTILHINHHYSMSNILETKTLEAYTSPFLVSISYIFLSLCNSLFFLPIDACRFINFFHNNQIVSLNLIFHLSFLCCFLAPTCSFNWVDWDQLSFQTAFELRLCITRLK